MTTERDRIIARTAADAQVLASVVIDLAAFLALAPEARAARWRQFDRSAKHQLVCQAIVKQTGRDWEPEEVAAGIAHYDAKYGSELMASEAAVYAALERLAEENARTARQARERHDADDARFFQRAANAYVKALRLYRDGVRPEQLPSGQWTLPSQRQGEPAHLLFKDGDWVCTCAAGASMHWASALIIGIELATDLLDEGLVGEAEIADSQYSIADSADGDDLSAIGYQLSAMSLGRALALARAELIADDLYGQRAA